MSESKPIEGLNGYMVCDLGCVINTMTGKVLWGTKKKSGYYEIALKDDEGIKHYALIHRLVAEAFCPKPDEEDDLEVNHIDGNKGNNCADNLEWITHGENLRHAYETGLRSQDVSPKAVVATNIANGEQVEFSSIYKAARFFGISQGNICMCCKGERPYAGGFFWAYAEEE